MDISHDYISCCPQEKCNQLSCSDSPLTGSVSPLTCYSLPSNLLLSTFTVLTCYSVDQIIHYLYFMYSWTQHTSTKINPSSLETQNLFLECLGFARHITLEAPGIFSRIEMNLGPNSFKYETGECPLRRLHSGRGRRTGLCSAPALSYGNHSLFSWHISELC